MHTQVTDQPYPCIFIQFSAKISTGFQESGCKTLSLLSSPFVQFHFKAITGNNRNNQTFIPCKTKSPPKNKLSILQQKWVATKKKDNLGFVSPSGVKRTKPRLTLFSILEDISHLYLSREELLLASGTLPLFEGAAKWYLCLGPLLRGFFYVNRIKCPKMHPQRSTKAMMIFKPAVNGQNFKLTLY